MIVIIPFPPEAGKGQFKDRPDQVDAVSFGPEVD
jgi:hypothetical protein